MQFQQILNKKVVSCLLCTIILELLAQEYFFEVRYEMIGFTRLR